MCWSLVRPSTVTDVPVLPVPPIAGAVPAASVAATSSPAADTATRALVARGHRNLADARAGLKRSVGLKRIADLKRISMTPPVARCWHGGSVLARRPSVSQPEGQLNTFRKTFEISL